MIFEQKIQRIDLKEKLNFIPFMTLIWALVIKTALKAHFLKSGTRKLNFDISNTKIWNFCFLTPNDQNFGCSVLMWPRETRRPNASFWYIICLGSKIFLFWPQMTTNPPNLGSGDLGWPWKPLFSSHGSLSFILIYNLPMLGNYWILTPNTPNAPKWP